MLGHKWSGAPSSKMVTHVGDLLHGEKEALKIRLIRESSEPYLEGTARLGIANVREINMPVKQKFHLMLRCKPQIVAP